MVRATKRLPVASETGRGHDGTRELLPSKEKRSSDDTPGPMA
jgi:hypothetical protein